MSEEELMEDRVFSLEELITKLYLVRQDVIVARQSRREVRERVGPCDHRDDSSPCWAAWSVDDKWCAACEEVRPYHDAYRKASTKAGAALRRVLREGKRLAAAEKEPKT
jgi:hypothetical protein